MDEDLEIWRKYTESLKKPKKTKKKFSDLLDLNDGYHNKNFDKNINSQDDTTQNNLNSDSTNFHKQLEISKILHENISSRCSSNVALFTPDGDLLDEASILPHYGIDTNATNDYQNYINQAHKHTRILKKCSIDRDIDLHGLTKREAYLSLYYFIAKAYMQNANTLLVVTGKGHRFDGKNFSIGALRSNVPVWLKTHKIYKGVIKAIYTSTQEKGGEGAYIIILKHF